MVQSQDSEFYRTKKDKDMKDNFKISIKKVMEHLDFRMVIDLLAVSEKINLMDNASISGQMEITTKANFQMGSDMAEGP